MSRLVLHWLDCSRGISQIEEYFDKFEKDLDECIAKGQLCNFAEEFFQMIKNKIRLLY